MSLVAGCASGGSWVMSLLKAGDLGGCAFLGMGHVTDHALITCLIKHLSRD